MESRTFKSIIFFKVSDGESIRLKESLSHIPFIKVFQCDFLEEVSQIVEMSSKTVILVDNKTSSTYLIEHKINNKSGAYRAYVLDWHSSLQEKDIRKLRGHAIAPLKTNDPKAVRERLELYLFGKVNIFYTHVKDIEETPQENSAKHAFWTQLEYSPESGWRTVVSSHEKEDDVSSFLGRNWDEFLEETTESAREMKGFLSARSKLHHQIVYPHFKNAQLYKLSIIHIAINEKVDENVVKALAFLKTF